MSNKAVVKIFRTIGESEENFNGCMIAATNTLLFLQVLEDFEFDGYAIVRKNDIKLIRHSSYERTYKKIIKSEGTFTNYGYDDKLSLKDWFSILSTLKKQDVHVIIENINHDYLDFWIGPLVKVTNKYVMIHNYDPNGIFDSKLTKINLDSISNIKFKDGYSTIFRKYLRKRP